MKILIYIFMLVPVIGFSQIDDNIINQLYELQPYSTYNECYKVNKKNYLITGGLVFLGGALNGIAEDMQFHYWEFKRTFPNANPKFWNPTYSWKNKYMDVDGGDYREKFPLSTTALAFTTDGYHLVRTSQRLMFTTSLVMTYDKKKNWKHYLTDMVLYTLVRSIGFHTTYSLIIK